MSFPMGIFQMAEADYPWRCVAIIVVGFRTEGLYRHGGAELEVRTEIEGDAPPVMQQSIEGRGPTEESVRELYSLVRRGVLAPVENWEALESWHGPSPTEREALDGRIRELEYEICRVKGIIKVILQRYFPSPAPDDPGSDEPTSQPPAHDSDEPRKPSADPATPTSESANKSVGQYGESDGA